MRLAKVLGAILAFAVIAGVIWILSEPKKTAQAEIRVEVSTPARPPIPLDLNRGADILDGFRGEVHPILFGQTRLEVTAYWTPPGRSGVILDNPVHKWMYSLFASPMLARPQQTYNERDFSAFLPQAVSDVGQIWALDAERIAEFLKQFHPRPQAHLVAPGRRAGPDGAFAMLRAMSPSHLDIVFRLHAEFEITPENGVPMPAGCAVYYTPASFSGSVLVNRQKGTVEYFRLGVPTDKTLNVHLTVTDGDHHQAPHDIVRVERLELLGGGREIPESRRWDTELPLADASARLARVYYRSQQINWVPFDHVLEVSQSEKRPIFAVLLWGSLDDQSC
ncbi:MAG: hypothetical protein HY040_27095 [Planctomycetes bacterium]|nr:hypothetical protein [Planctomycetota bacterium]